MNIALSSRHSVHVAHADGVTVPACNGFGAPAGAESYRVTAREVTCKKCLKMLAFEAEQEAAYQARLEASMMPATEGHDMGEVTTAQATALQTIWDNPGKVIAMTRGNRAFLTINGNTENKLRTLGMIQMRRMGTTVTNGKTHDLKVWELTGAGRAALGVEQRTCGATAVAFEAAAGEQPAEIIAIREDARDTAENARRDAAILRATAKLGTPAATEAAQCTCPCTWQCERPADEDCTCPCTCGAQAAEAAQQVRDAAHAEALAFQDRVRRMSQQN